MSHQEVIQLANKMLAKIADTVMQSQFDAERARLERLSTALESKLMAIAGEIEGDVRALWERKVDPQMLRNVMKTHREVVRLYNELKSHKVNPHSVADRLIMFTTTSPDKEVLDQLIASTDQHVQSTNEDFAGGKMIIHPKNLGLRRLKILGNVVKSYLLDNPLIVPKETVRPPAPPTEPHQTDVIPPVAFDATPPSPGNEVNTNPAVPSAKAK